MALDYEFDNITDQFPAIGLVVLQSDLTLENEFRRLFADASVRIYHSRIPNSTQVNKETLAQMAAELPQSVALFPHEEKMQAIAYGCTSGATIIGRDTISQLIQSIKPEAKTTDPISAVVAACKALNITKLGLLTPYIESVSLAMRLLLEKEGISITAFSSFEQEDDASVARISEKSTLQAIAAIGQDDQCDAIFASCTNLQTFGILQQAEEIIGKPVLSSNQALAWHLSKLCGLKHGFSGYGSLLTA